MNQYNSNDKAYGRFAYYYDREKGIVHSTGRYKDGIPFDRWVTYHEAAAGTLLPGITSVGQESAVFMKTERLRRKAGRN